MGATARFSLRLSVITVLAALAALRLALGDASITPEEIIQITETTLLAAAAYAGVGLATPAEPRLKIQPDDE